ncbi:PQQ-dependent sugar dehydrogenase [Rufibacter roseus]|uniref:PQQ-dependent sugar dehydrogenase n=1 Tax=Rufibacter roseus TaxID=1567108 RepID=A0ABW2DJ06_9BACT|nr:PQQ-dependent sugar dehydrogenase [Rufibacter roseus]
MVKFKQITAALLFSAMGLYSCINSNGSKTAPVVADEEVLSEEEAAIAKNNYINYCGGCHGRELQTFINRNWQHGSSRENLFEGIKHGYPNQGMPAFASTLSDKEIIQLVTYIRQGIKNQENNGAGQEQNSGKVYQSDELSFRLDTVVTGLNIVWGMAFLPNGDMLLTEKSGKLYRFTQNKQLQQIEGAPEVLDQGQGGMLDVELHPAFAQNNVIYLSYSAVKRDGGTTLSTTAVMRARLEGNALKDQKVIFEGQPWERTRHHYGSRLEFGPDGFLYVTMGDRGGTKTNPQNLGVSAGKVHRIKEDGSIPADNPFVNQRDALPSIFTYGNRNPQGMALNPDTKEIWINEHGPKGGDEINIIQKGHNYGWAIVTHGIDYNGSIISDLKQKEGVTDPVKIWTPSIAPSGTAFVTGNRYKGWQGDALVGSLSFRFLSRVKVDGNKVTGEERLLQDIGRVRDVKMSPDGYIYISVEKVGVLRLVPVN